MKEYWFKSKNGTLRLAVPLNEISHESSAEIKTENIIGKGEISYYSGTNASEISISSFFPSKNYSFCQYSSFPTPQESVDFFENIKNSGETVTFIVTDTEINKEYYISKFTTTIKQYSDDRYFTLLLKEAINPEIERILQLEDYGGLKNASRPSKREGTKIVKKTVLNTKQKTYTVQRGDTLSAIAHKYYGDAKMYTKIYNANKNIIKNPNMIKTGWKLVIP